jgi:hypothetical protein
VKYLVTRHFPEAYNKGTTIQKGRKAGELLPETQIIKCCLLLAITGQLGNHKITRLYFIFIVRKYEMRFQGYVKQTGSKHLKIFRFWPFKK